MILIPNNQPLFQGKSQGLGRTLLRWKHVKQIYNPPKKIAPGQFLLELFIMGSGEFLGEAKGPDKAPKLTIYLRQQLVGHGNGSHYP